MDHSDSAQLEIDLNELGHGGLEHGAQFPIRNALTTSVLVQYCIPSENKGISGKSYKNKLKNQRQRPTTVENQAHEHQNWSWHQCCCCV